MTRRDGGGASTNLLSDGLAVAGPGAVCRSEPESGAAFGIGVVLRRRHRRTADGDDARRRHRAKARSLLIPPRLTHHLTCLGRGLVSCYLEPTSVRAECLPAAGCRRVARRNRRWLMWPRNAAAFTPTDDESACRLARSGCAVGTPRRIDPRIAGRGTPDSRRTRRRRCRRTNSPPRRACPSRDSCTCSATSWVRACGATGCGCGSCTPAPRSPAGANLTEAAMKSGFASPSHLADRFKSTFGLSASHCFGTGLTLRTP